MQAPLTRHALGLFAALGLTLIGLAAAACQSSAVPAASGTQPAATPTPGPSVVITQDSISVPDAGLNISYDERVTETEEDAVQPVQRQSFYSGDALVFTAYDGNDDNCDELWFEYNDEQYLTIEMQDTDGDCRPDRFIYFDRDENVLREESR